MECLFYIVSALPLLSVYLLILSIFSGTSAFRSVLVVPPVPVTLVRESTPFKPSFCMSLPLLLPRSASSIRGYPYLLL